MKGVTSKWGRNLGDCVLGSPEGFHGGESKQLCQTQLRSRQPNLEQKLVPLTRTVSVECREQMPDCLRLDH